MKILVISDNVSRSIYNPEAKEKFPAIDCIISCGDLPKDYLEFVVTTFNIPCFFVPGNHDESFRKAPPPGWTNLDGQIVKFKSLRLMGLGGSKYYNGRSPFQYTEKQMLWRYFKLFPKLWWHRNQVDIFVTHSPAFELGDLDDRAHTGYKVFLNILDKIQPRVFLHGHVHLNYSNNLPRIQKYRNTEVINGYEHYLLELED